MGWFVRLKSRPATGEHGTVGFLGRLRRDKRGATLAMMAAFVIPMIGVVGGAVDISRAYLVKVRLQQACDAGVLAARRTMTGSSVANDTNAKTQATNFFKINLKNGAYGSTVTPIVVSDVLDAANKPTGTVSGAASASVPTTLMKVFGKTTMAMAATCEATLQVANNDVMFVLDVTGSMNCNASDNGPYGCNNNHVEKSDAKIKALRTAVVDFYDTLKAATTATARLRIGITPYSTTVNVGKQLYAANPAWIADSAPYQSRQRVIASYNSSTSNGNWTSVTNSTGSWSSTKTLGSSTTQANCPPSTSTSYGTTTSVNGATTTDPNTNIKTTPITNTRSATDTEYQLVSWTKTSGYGSSALGTCKYKQRTVQRTETRVDTKTDTPVYNWKYDQFDLDTSSYKAGNAVTTMTGDGFTSQSWTWSGCIEERQTVAQATFSSIPTDAFDLQIDKIPDSDPSTQWKPQWTGLIYSRSQIASEQSTNNNSQPSDSGTDAVACPKQVQKLAVLSHDDVYNYVNASDFVGNGNTYHDVGMLWGARLLSPTGLFASENTTAPNGLPINRSIVFMTDGDMMPSRTAYGLYGYEVLDRRVSGAANTPSDADLKIRHNSRFSAICEAIKDMNITIYVVAYSQSMTTELEDCATPGKDFYAADDDDLKAAFQKIARQIAQLRLSK